MIRHLSRPIYGLILTVCLALPPGCSEPAPKAPVGASPEQTRQLKQRLEEVYQRAARLDNQIERLDEEQARRLDALTSESQSLLAEIGDLGQQLGGQPFPALAAKGAPAKSTAAAEKSKKSPLSPLVRLLLVVIILFAIWIIARIFLGRLSEEDEDEDDFGTEAADEELTTEEGTIRISREARPAAGQPQEPPRGEGENDNPKPKP